MKNILKTIIFSAAAVSLAASCAKETDIDSSAKGLDPAEPGKELHFTVTPAGSAPIAEVKSWLDNNLDGTYTPKWSKGDEIAVFTISIVKDAKSNGTLNNISEDGTDAEFDGVLTAADEGVFKAVSPAGRFVQGYAPENNTEYIAVSLGDKGNGYVQNPTNVTIDPDCDILVSKPVSYSSGGTDVVLDDIYFKRVMSVVKINLNAPEASFADEKVKNFTLASSSVTLAGRAKIDITNAKVVDWTVVNKSIKAVYASEDDMPVLYDADNLLNSVYLVVNPTTLAIGETLTFSGDTENYTFSKEVTLTQDIVFPESQMAVINLSLEESNLTKKDTLPTYIIYEDELVEGDYLIVYGGRAMKAEVSSKRLDYAEVTVSDNAIQTSDGSIVWHIEESGDYWTIFNDGVQQFAAGTASKNEAQLLADGTDNKSLWTATMSSGTFEFVNKANNVKGVNDHLRGNGTNGFACYSTATGGALSLYKLNGTIEGIYKVSIASGIEGGTLTASPRRTKEGAEVTLTATPSEGYEFNGDWSVKDSDGVEVSVTDGKFTMPAKDVTVSGSFKKSVYTITKAEATGGSFTVKIGDAEVSEASYNDVVVLSATADEGYEFDKWNVTNNDTGKTVYVSDSSFVMPAANVTVAANFLSNVVPVYASLSELIAAGTPTTDGTLVTVTLSEEKITKFYKSGNYINGVYFMVGTQEIEIYCKNAPSDWAVGGYVSGTLTKCKWMLYSSIWELCPDDYTELSYEAPVETPVITLDGAVATITCATEGAAIHYTVGESPADPTESDAVYSSPVTLTDGQTIKAIAVKSAKMTSDVVSKKYSAGGGKEIISGSVKFGSADGSISVKSKEVTGKDAAGTSWTVTTVGTTSFTPSSGYNQIGSSSKPATSITIVGTNASASSIESVSVKFGGFSGTAGTVSIKVGDVEVGTGKLNGTNDVTVSSTCGASGNTITITVTGISKGVKLYGVDYTYSE